MRSRLFLKIYATVIACLAVVALTSALFVKVGFDEEDRGWAARRDSFLLAMLPEESDPVSNGIMLERLGTAFEADISLYAGDGDLIASVGRPLPLPRGLDDDHDWKGGIARFATRLEDGRVIVARFTHPFRPDGRRSPLLWLALIAGVTALAAYPVVRHLTRRLEALRTGVGAWGKGDLSRRVKVDGRDEVAMVAAAFNTAAERIERLVAAHRGLLANASHELRSPLARLRMAVELEQQAPDTRRRQEILTNLAEMDELVEEILLSSRLDHHATTLRIETVDLTAIAAEEAAVAGAATGGDPAAIRGDARLLRRLVRNLVQNALRHGAPPIVVEILQTMTGVELSVTDRGPGIAEADRARLFEPFYRPEGRAESGGGWGLGLALVRQIAERHGATVRVESPAAGGSRFVVSFPASVSASG